MLCEESKYNLVMAISEFEIKRIEKIVGEFIEKKRPEPHIRDKLDIAFGDNVITSTIQGYITRCYKGVERYV